MFLYLSKTYVEVYGKIFGKWIGKIASLLYLFYLYYLSSVLLREIGDFFTTQIMVETPFQMIMIMFLLTNLIGVRVRIRSNLPYSDYLFSMDRYAAFLFNYLSCTSNKIRFLEKA
ncbi:GerAB/ArcD/ProY family transporter [Neobacillus niacini]|uniref:GerAB/ArcD/ProY family transporter n=1 Tax=Neobacillus niacini TaxID=86668 RepID=UPI00358E5A24